VIVTDGAIVEFVSSLGLTRSMDLLCGFESFGAFDCENHARSPLNYAPAPDILAQTRSFSEVRFESKRPIAAGPPTLFALQRPVLSAARGE
jgi:hypothetical protein